MLISAGIICMPDSWEYVASEIVFSPSKTSFIVALPAVISIAFTVLITPKLLTAKTFISNIDVGEFNSW